MRKLLIAAAVVGVLGWSASAAGAAAVPTANLDFKLAVPAVGFATTTDGNASLTVGTQVRVALTVHSSGPDAVSGLVARLSRQSTTQSAWVTSLSPNGAPFSGGQLVGIGTLAPGQSRTVFVYVTPKVVGTKLLLTFNIDPVTGEVLNEPAFDRAGDFGAAALFTAVAPAATPPPTSPVLAETGSHSGELVGLAVGLIAAGAGVLYLARRRPTEW